MEELEKKVNTIAQRLETLEVAFRMASEENNRRKEQEKRFEEFLHDKNLKLYQLWMQTRGA